MMLDTYYTGRKSWVSQVKCFTSISSDYGAGPRGGTSIIHVLRSDKCKAPHKSATTEQPSHYALDMRSEFSAGDERRYAALSQFTYENMADAADATP